MAKKKKDDKPSAYIIVNETTGFRINSKIYDSMGPAKNAVRNYYENYARSNLEKVVIKEIEFAFTGKEWFLHEDKWTEHNGVSKFLYG